MYVTHDTITPARPDQQSPSASGLAGKWAQGRRRMTPWAYPRLRALAALRFAIGIFLTGLGVALIASGHPGWAVIPLIGAALHFAIACLDGSAVRSARSHR